MKKFKNLFKVFAVALTVALACCAFAACGGDDSEEDYEGSIAGVYTLVSGDITYELTIADNNDFGMKITKKFADYSVTKHYAGPIHNISGIHCSTMPVFLSDLEYNGNGAPNDNDEVLDGLKKAFSAFTSQNADGADGRERYITLSIKNKTFRVDDGHSYTTLDYTEGLWTRADLVAAGYIQA